jgi:hypothetical protein
MTLFKFVVLCFIVFLCASPSSELVVFDPGKWLYRTRSEGLTGYSCLSVLLPLRVRLGHLSWNNSGCSTTASSSVASWWVVSTRARALPFFSASSAAFAASSAFELALLGAITGGFFVARRHGGRQMLELALLGKLIQREDESNVNRVLARDGNSSVNLASQGHYAGVFIGI